MDENKLLDVEIVTPQIVIFSGKAVSVTVPGTKGPFQILNMHAPIVSTLDIGLTKIVDESDKAHLFATGSGFTEVHRNKVSILVESAFESGEINIEDEKIKLLEAKEAIKNKKDIELNTIAALEAENKIKAAQKFRN